MGVGGAEVEFCGTERFEIRRELGSGGMGIVYEGFDRERGVAIAVKTLRHASGRALRRFKNEFRALQRIEHRNLVSLGELVTDGRQWFFTMELVNGVDIVSYVRRNEASPARADTVSPSADTLRAEVVADRWSAARGPFDEARLRASFRQLADAIETLHGAGVVHRDIKPANILVTREGRVVLLDLGLAMDMVRSEAQSFESGIIGTAAYMAPEQASGADVGPAADWYSLGVVLYEALTGELPHDGRTPMEILFNRQQQVPPPPRTHNPDVPHDLDRLCTALLACDPASRPTSRDILTRLQVTAAPSASVSATSQSPPFVGRECELAQLDAELAAVKREGARAVWIEGASGIGKSALLAEAVERFSASNEKLVVLAGRCYENELVPFNAFDSVVDSLSRWLARLSEREIATLVPRHIAILMRMFPALERVECFASLPPETQLVREPHEMRARAFAALGELLARVSDRWALVITIDDMQWVDSDSLLLLRDLLLRAEPARMLLILAARSDESSQTSPPLRERLLSALGATPIAHIRLAALPANEATTLATRLGGIDGETAVAIAKEAAGHPLFISELCRHLTPDKRRDHRPIKLTEAISSRIAPLPEEARQILTLVCVSEAPVLRSILASAARIDEWSVDRHITRLRHACLVRTADRSDAVAAYHARVIEAVLAQLDHATRCGAHRRLANAFETASGAREAPERLVRHLVAAGEPARAARYAESAANRAVANLAFDRASDLFRIALELGGPAAETTRRLQMALAEALVGAGRGPEAADAFLSASEGADPATVLSCRRRAADQLIITGHIERGLRVLQELLTDIGEPLPSTPRRAIASLLWNRARLRVRGLRFRGRQESEIPASELMRADVLGVIGPGLAMVDAVRAMDYNARFVRAALDTGETSRILAGLATYAALQTVGDARARRRGVKIYERVKALADERSDPKDRIWLETFRGAHAFFAGEFEVAADVLSHALLVTREHQDVGSTWMLHNNLQTMRMFAHRFRGEFDVLRDVAHECLLDAERRGDRYMATTARVAATRAWLAADDVDGAQENLARNTWTPPATEIHIQHWRDFEAQVELALYAGRATDELERAERRFNAFNRSVLSRLQIVRCPMRWLLASLLLAARPDQHSRVGKLCRLLERERDASYPAVFASLGRAAIAHHAGDIDSAVAALQSASERADTCHLRAHAAAARRRLGSILGGDEGTNMMRNADAALRGCGVARPDRMTELLAPGFL